MDDLADEAVDITEEKVDGKAIKAIKEAATPTAEKKMYVRPRNVNLALRVTEEERAMIEKRMAQTGMGNLRAYMVKMAIDGRVIHVELESVREMVRLLSTVSNNINQLTKLSHMTGNIRTGDIERLRGHVEDIWAQVKEILRKLAAL